MTGRSEHSLIQEPLLRALLGECSGACSICAPAALACDRGSRPAWSWQGDALRIVVNGQTRRIVPGQRRELPPILDFEGHNGYEVLRLRVTEPLPHLLLFEYADSYSACFTLFEVPKSTPPAEWVLDRIDPSQQLASSVFLLGPVLDGVLDGMPDALPWYGLATATGGQRRLAQGAHRAGLPGLDGGAIVRSRIAIEPKRLRALLLAGQFGEAAAVAQPLSIARAAWWSYLAELATREAGTAAASDGICVTPVNLSDIEARTLVVLARDGWSGTAATLIAAAQALAQAPEQSTG